MNETIRRDVLASMRLPLCERRHWRRSNKKLYYCDDNNKKESESTITATYL